MDFWDIWETIEEDESGYKDWAFLENEAGAEGELQEDFKNLKINLYTFLHGECTIFSQYLKNKYGYKCQAIFEYNRLVHMYCIDNKGSYIDIRGRCDNFDKLMKDFYDLGMYDNMDDISFKTYKIIPGKYSDRSEGKKYLKLCEKIDKAYGYWG